MDAYLYATGIHLLNPGVRKREVVQGRSWAIYKPDINRISLLRKLRNSLKKSDLDMTEGQLQTGRKGHCLTIITYREKKYFLKYFIMNKLSWNRRLELGAKEVWQTGPQKSFLGALRLKMAGIPTADPVGYCSTGTKPWSKKGVFVCEYLENKGTVQDYLNNPDTSFLKSELLSNMAHMARRIHDHGLRHTDIVEHNFLVRPNHIGKPEIVLIDTDKVHPVGLSRFIPPLKKFLDLRCLMRLKYQPLELEWFLREYFGSDYHPAWLKTLLFLRNGGFSLRRRLKLIRKKGL